jgi:SOS response regulatory protein OraA/RecX
MITFHRSATDPNWLELQEDGAVLQEVEVRFNFRKMDHVCLTVEEALTFLKETERKQGKSYAYWLLSAKSYPSTLLGKKLSEKGYSADVVQEILEKLETLGLTQDEEWFAREVARELSAGHGPRLIESKWKVKGLPSEKVRAYLTDAMQEEKIQQLWPKFCARKKDRQKAIQALVRRGFDFGLVLRVCS